MTTRNTVDGLVDGIIAAFPDMETYELAELEIAVNAELQKRAVAMQQPVTYCDCEDCKWIREGKSLDY